MTLPSISIITPTYNCDLKLFKQSLESIEKQDYPKSLIEHIAIDAGSKNGTLQLAKSYGCKIIRRPDLLYETQVRMSLGIKSAKNELILILEADNMLLGKDWFKKMVLPFVEEKSIVCTFSLHLGYKKEMPALTRYFALIGVNDAFLYYLDKSEKLPMDEKKYNKGQALGERKDYYIVRFTPDNLPPMGDNGFMVRKSIIDKVNKKSEDFIHVDAFADMVSRGFDTFGVVKNSIIHYCGSSIISQYKNRVTIKKRFYDNPKRKRTYLTFDPNSFKDRWNLIKFIFASATFIIPLIRSIKGYLKVKERAWFLHPIVCFIALFMYTRSEISFQLRKLALYVQRS